MKAPYWINRNHLILISIIVLAATISLCVTIAPSNAEEVVEGASAPGMDMNKIHITSDQLIYDSNSRYAEFIGNVKARQTDTVIFADRLKLVHYEEKYPGDTGTGSNADETIEKIEATGNVKIIFDNKVAITQQAIYITKTRVLMLIGNNSTISSGTDSISGAKIILDRNDGRIKIESGQDQQVKAILHSGDNALMK